MIALQTLKLPVGEMLAGASSGGICLLEFFHSDRVAMQLPRLERLFGERTQYSDCDHFVSLQAELDEYFSGQRTTFSVPLDIRGTEFQVKAWNSLLEIPFGEIRSYEEQARAIGNVKAVRAVANANRNNRISILVPCHRVIGKNGSMTGYGGGIERKEYLLKLEGASIGESSPAQLPLF